MKAKEMAIEIMSAKSIMSAKRQSLKCGANQRLQKMKAAIENGIGEMAAIIESSA
jgi:hypothetical protein